MNASGWKDTKPTMSPSFFMRLKDDARTFRAMMRDYREKVYPTTPVWSIASIAVALVYMLNPSDLINDFIPIFGQLDDMGVISLAWMLVRRDLKTYRAWRVTKDLGDEIPNE